MYWKYINLPHSYYAYEWVFLIKLEVIPINVIVVELKNESFFRMKLPYRKEDLSQSKVK